MRHFTRSQTVGIISASETSDLSASPSTLQKSALQPPAIPHKSSKRNLHSAMSSRGATRDLSNSPRKRSIDGLVRPLPKSQASQFKSSDRGTRSVTQSCSSSFLDNTGRFKGGSPIKKGGNNVGKIGYSATSVLVTSQDLTGSAADSVDSGGRLKTSRSRTKNVFAKFTGVLTDHFGHKRSRKHDKSDEAREKFAGRDVSPKQIAHDIPLGKSAHPPLAHIKQNFAGTSLQSQHEADNTQKQKAGSITGRNTESPLMESKRLTIVDEVDFQSGQLMEDPFSESSGQHSTEFEARLRSKQASQGGANPTDPFQVERILETSVDAILTTPPVGCSTPRRQSRSFSRCESPSKGSRDHSDDTPNFISMTLAKPLRRRKVDIIRESPRKGNIGLKPEMTNNGSIEKSVMGLQMPISSDSTRLSSYPPGSTIRHVPRSMGRLKDVPSLPVSTAEGTRRQPLARKKHPSPSKGQLEMFGQYMEKNLALGVFKDSDELGMSFNSPQASADTLSPRDKNRLMIRGSADSNVSLRKDYKSHDNRTGLTKSRSRIPQPVRQLSRSRTDTAFARDFYPVNKGDSTVDELQWDMSPYKIGQRCNHCGSMNEIV